MQRSVFSRSSLWWTFLPYGVVAVVHVVALGIGSDLAAPTKLWLMPLLAVPILLSLPLRPTIAPVLLLTAVLLSWLGDGSGAFFPALPTLPVMLGFFALAHVAYILVFLRVLGRGPLPRWTLVYATWWVAMIAVLGPHTGSLFIAVAAYGLVLGGTAALSARCHPVILAGGAFFLLSDTILAFRLFVPEAMPAWTSPAVMLTYTLGQGLIVAGALLTLRAGRKNA